MENEKKSYDLEKLTAKNADYIHTITRHLTAAGYTEDENEKIISEILPQITEAQQAGITARSLLGSPSHFVNTCNEKKKQAANAPTKNPFLMTLDSTLLVFSLLAGLNGLMTSFAKNNQATYGILALILSSIAGGLGMYQVYRIQQKNMALAEAGQLTKLQRITPIFVTLAYVLVWFAVTVLSLNIPATINIKLPGLYLLVVAVLVFAFKFWLKKRYNIQSATISSTAQRRQ